MQELLARERRVGRAANARGDSDPRAPRVAEVTGVAGRDSADGEVREAIDLWIGDVLAEVLSTRERRVGLGL